MADTTVVQFEKVAAMTDTIITEKTITDTTHERTLHHAPVEVCDGVRANFPANPDTTAAAAAAAASAAVAAAVAAMTDTIITEKTITDTTHERTLHHAPVEICDGVRANFPANPDTTTTAAAVATIAETTDHHSLPPTQRTEITSLEYFKFILEEVLSEQHKIHLKEAIACAPRPSPVRNSLTRADYMEMSAAWDEPTFRKYKNRKGFRMVYSMTVRSSVETSKRRLRRVTFGSDPTLKSDRWVRKHPLRD